MASIPQWECSTARVQNRASVQGRCEMTRVKCHLSYLWLGWCEGKGSGLLVSGQLRLLAQLSTSSHGLQNWVIKIFQIIVMQSCYLCFAVEVAKDNCGSCLVRLVLTRELVVLRVELLNMRAANMVITKYYSASISY
jgi:hypothetical protein